MLIEESFRKGAAIPLCNFTFIQAWLCFVVNEYLAGIKTYSLCGQMLLQMKNYKLAAIVYTKLVNTSYSMPEPQPSEFKLYSYKQLSFTYLQLKEYNLALKSAKRMLQLAWVVDSCTAEMGAYELMSQSYFYLGDLRKSGYYNKRCMQGITEAKFSRVRKINVISSEDHEMYLKRP